MFFMIGEPTRTMAIPLTLRHFMKDVKKGGSDNPRSSKAGTGIARCLTDRLPNNSCNDVPSKPRETG
jgi:hypothetical protein